MCPRIAEANVKESDCPFQTKPGTFNLETSNSRSVRLLPRHDRKTKTRCAMKTPDPKLKNLKETCIPCPSFRRFYTVFTYLSPLRAMLHFPSQLIAITNSNQLRCGFITFSQSLPFAVFTAEASSQPLAFTIFTPKKLSALITLITSRKSTFPSQVPAITNSNHLTSRVWDSNAQLLPNTSVYKKTH